MKFTSAAVDKFNDSYQRIPEVGCWIWERAVPNAKNLYGSFYADKKVWRAHRFSYALYVGDPEGLDVLHRCDTPCCVNPHHLFLGTQADNNRDMTSKGRNRSKPRISACKHGHEFTPENTRFLQGGKRCLKCMRIRREGYEARAKALGMTYGYTAKSKPRWKRELA